MTTMAIIGTAGRRDDRPRMTRDLWDLMVSKAVDIVQIHEPTILVSGGAAWADHLAVYLYLENIVPDLQLHFPSNFINSRFLPDSYGSPGGTANYWHDQMSRVLGTSTRRQIQLAIDKGAKTTCSEGFKARNLLVGAQAKDYLLAFTFGTKSGTYTKPHSEWKDAVLAGLKRGGTAHTWDTSTSRVKEHVNLWEL